MLQLAKNKLKSKSEVPNHMLIKGSTSSFGDGDQAEQHAALKAQVNSLKELQKYNIKRECRKQKLRSNFELA